ncbi:hypothetical protein PPERSA_03995 [Pseudocohnilembus persalinus]|uniref:MORN motif n=1 Tax=Pseudocohnilembus persalinus TaxID=266149 RepID=A0A0V0QBC7_PSEPJ|nr:hypothetical protein PPERSA_03995 [Pseudocohnilembus persalinus]|eukprot:KRW99525.1 hypothetical protein PPERSA_03995 [Pseudocohnilembus persalinus]
MLIKVNEQISKENEILSQQVQGLDVTQGISMFQIKRENEQLKSQLEGYVKETDKWKEKCQLLEDRLQQQHMVWEEYDRKNKLLSNKSANQEEQQNIDQKIQLLVEENTNLNQELQEKANQIEQIQQELSQNQQESNLNSSQQNSNNNNQLHQIIEHHNREVNLWKEKYDDLENKLSQIIEQQNPKNQNLDDQQNGKGKQFWLDGSIFEGYFIDDKINGKGILIQGNTDFYVGEFKDELFCGKGKFISENGLLIQIGQWEKNSLHGKGVKINPNGQEIENIWYNGQIIEEQNE